MLPLFRTPAGKIETVKRRRFWRVVARKLLSRRGRIFVGIGILLLIVFTLFLSASFGQSDSHQKPLRKDEIVDIDHDISSKDEDELPADIYDSDGIPRPDFPDHLPPPQPPTTPQDSQQYDQSEEAQINDEPVREEEFKPFEETGFDEQQTNGAGDQTTQSLFESFEETQPTPQDRDREQENESTLPLDRDERKDNLTENNANGDSQSELDDFGQPQVISASSENQEEVENPIPETENILKNAKIEISTDSQEGEAGDGGETQFSSFRQTENKNENENENAKISDDFGFVGKEENQNLKIENEIENKNNDGDVVAEQPIGEIQNDLRSKEENEISDYGKSQNGTLGNSENDLQQRIEEQRVLADGDDAENAQRRAAIKEAFLDAWTAYDTHAFGFDELKPVSKKGHNWVKDGIGMTIIDGLDTMIIMGLEDEYQKCREWIQNSLSFDKDANISVFETTIRILGGLLSAFDLTGDKLFLNKAVDIGDRLMYAFNSTSGVPYSSVNLATHFVKNPSWTSGRAILAEYGSLTLEFRRLSQLTGNGAYAEKVDNVLEILGRLTTVQGLFPLYIDQLSLKISSDQISFGALGDSFYEYLLKAWIQTGRTESRVRDLYDSAMTGASNLLIKQTQQTPLTYIAEYRGRRAHDKMDHLACFVGGMYALGAEGTTFDHHMQLAKDMATTCREMYTRMATGLAPEYVVFDGANKEMTSGAHHFLLRPETIETFFYLWRVTKDQKYRDWGWEIFQSMQRHCRVSTGGYSGIVDVNQVPPVQDDHMQSFLMAETFKYLYLLFSPDDVIPLEEFVFNTEAHPIRIIHPDR